MKTWICFILTTKSWSGQQMSNVAKRSLKKKKQANVCLVGCFLLFLLLFFANDQIKGK